MTKMLSLSSWTIVDPNLTLPLVVFIGILMGFTGMGFFHFLTEIRFFQSHLGHS